MKSAIVFIIVVVSLSLHAQKNDYIWCIGHSSLTEGTILNFNTDPAELAIVPRETHFAFTNSSICDENGNLLVYTNGSRIDNYLGLMMENGDSLNFPYFGHPANYGYSVPQGAFFLQNPGNSNQYYLFHMWKEWIPAASPLYLRYSLIDFTYNNGLGKVIEKNIPLLSGDGQLNFNQATAVRHANGRDWWILVPHHMQPEYYRLLLTPEGIEGPWIQEIGFKEPTTVWITYPYGQRGFSPDGTKFADYDYTHYVQVFDFDRCSGLLSNPVKIPYQVTGTVGNMASGITFSPSGRYLYITRAVANGNEVVQFDVQAPDIAASEQVIQFCANPSSIQCGLANMALGPDGKIYIPALDSTAFHIIHQPDSAGLACDFEYGGLVFPLNFPESWLPYYPNYRLGKIEDSPCDTIVSATSQKDSDRSVWIKIAPNPVGEYLNFSWSTPLPAKEASIRISNLVGETLYEILISSSETQITVSAHDWPAGIYFIQYLEQGVVYASKKFVKQ